MSRLDALFAHIRDGHGDASIRFDALRTLLDANILNLQRDGRNAKDYQVRQVRRAILKYNLKLRG